MDTVVFNGIDFIYFDRFTEPAHDLCIQCQDVVQLKSFLILVISLCILKKAKLLLYLPGEKVHGRERFE